MWFKAVLDDVKFQIFFEETDIRTRNSSFDLFEIFYKREEKYTESFLLWNQGVKEFVISFFAS